MSDYARCEGRTGVLHRSSVLAHECVRCARRTADRSGERVIFVEPPRQHPCQIRIDQDDLEDGE